MLAFVALYLVIGLIYTTALLAFLNRLSGGALKGYCKEFFNSIPMKIRFYAGWALWIVIWPTSFICCIAVAICVIFSVIRFKKLKLES